MKTIDFISLGCSKNLVDSERLMGLCEAHGYRCTHDSDHPQGEIVVVNTCGFIADAKEESINTILEFAKAKTEGRLERLYVMGCLSERYLADLESEIPEVDGWFGKFNYHELIDSLPPVSSPAKTGEGGAVVRHLTTPRHYAYVKIAEGCDRSCAYCAIPLITGHHRSRPVEEILDEVRWLVGQGVTELQVIAQELTYYGVDLYGERRLPELVERMAQVEGVRWIRLHYAYPNQFPWELTRVMREHPNVCRYLDIALQHVSDPVLERMHRHTTKAETMALVERLRREVPGIHLRTTLMVGYPGETDADFQELVDFVRWARFDYMYAFSYSEEDGTWSAQHLADDVPPEVKQARQDKLMRIQQNISAELLAAKVGQRHTVVIDRREGDYYVGRTQYSSPEIDTEVLIAAQDGPLQVGEYYEAEMTDSEEFDLYARIIKQVKI